jgi:hypothetical protein
MHETSVFPYFKEQYFGDHLRNGKRPLNCGTAQRAFSSFTSGRMAGGLPPIKRCSGSPSWRRGEFFVFEGFRAVGAGKDVQKNGAARTTEKCCHSNSAAPQPTF